MDARRHSPLPKVAGLPIPAIPVVSLAEAAFCGLPALSSLPSMTRKGDILYPNHGFGSDRRVSESVAFRERGR